MFCVNNLNVMLMFYKYSKLEGPIRTLLIKYIYKFISMAEFELYSYKYNWCEIIYYIDDIIAQPNIRPD